jgi:hypothetical protein
MNNPFRRASHAIALLVLGGCSSSDALLASNVHGDAGTGGADANGAIGGQPSTGGALTTGGRVGAGGSATGGSSASGGATGTGGGSAAGGTAGARDCPFATTTITWGPDGGLRLYQWHASFGPDGFKRWTDILGTGVTRSVDNCWPAPCTDGVPEYDAVRQALVSADVQGALAQAPVLYGGDLRPVDGAVLEIRVNDRIIDVGTPCWPDLASCAGVPPGVQALALALLKLELRAVTDCAIQCRPEARVIQPQCSQSGLYVWTGLTCEPMAGSDVGGLSCGVPQYYTAADCVAGHAECLGLFTHACGGAAGNTCDADEYCAYTVGQNCGRNGEQSVCQPKPATCTLISLPVCGCDGQVQGNSCFAAAAGVGMAVANECTWTCASDGDCAWQSPYCYEQGGSGVISLTPFCLDGTCQCECGHRDASGAFVHDMCD